MLLRALAPQMGQPVSVIQQELLAHLGVKTLNQLSEAHWNPITAWLQLRLGWDGNL